MSKLLHKVEGQIHVYVDVILPLHIAVAYTYYLPADQGFKEPQVGCRVQVALRGKEYSGIVVRLHQTPPNYATKPIISILDDVPILHPQQLELWRWLADYYCCSLGDVMQAALPAHLKMTSETRFSKNPMFEDNALDLSDQLYLIAEALEHNESLTLKDIQAILQKKTVEPIIRQLLERGVMLTTENLQNRYRPKTVACVRWAEEFGQTPTSRDAAFNLLIRAPKQAELLLAYIMLSKTHAHVTVSDLLERAQTSRSVLLPLLEKGILTEYKHEVSRLDEYEHPLDQEPPLDLQQITALEEIQSAFTKHNTTLLYGVTGSGKTRLYIELIRQTIAAGGQVLYLIPEIALSVQLTQRLKKYFGDSMHVYHSKLNDNERVEIWQAVYDGLPFVLGVRSAFLLPFNNLQLIIVDEEHDPSFKQNDPAPRFQARDAAVYLGATHAIKVLLGSATPSVESYYNAKSGKYGLVRMSERHGESVMPLIELVDMRAPAGSKPAQRFFSDKLIQALTQAQKQNKQSILFQNRRGYAPSMTCFVCGWVQKCINCDVTMTYHKGPSHLSCHYCGYTITVPTECPACASQTITYRGMGTERIEDEIKIYLPEARVDRLDLDTSRTKDAHSKIIGKFEQRQTDILVGTQMVSKGLDFNDVLLVGIVNADSALHYPDYRAHERTYQLLTQVAGRAGRRAEQGLVYIQTHEPDHPVLEFIKKGNYSGFYLKEIEERRVFGYPPFMRLIKLTLKHPKPETVNTAAKYMSEYLRSLPQGVRVDGPAIPVVGRVKNQFLIEFLIRLPRSGTTIKLAKQQLQESAVLLNKQHGLSQVRCVFDVDP
jgi:primosomal protein N' (replication factor Y)